MIERAFGGWRRAARGCAPNRIRGLNGVLAAGALALTALAATADPSSAAEVGASPGGRLDTVVARSGTGAPSGVLDTVVARSDTTAQTGDAAGASPLRAVAQPPDTPTPTAPPSPTSLPTASPTWPPTETPFTPAPTATVALSPTPTRTLSPPPLPTPSPVPSASTATPAATAISSMRSASERPIVILESVRVDPQRPAPGDSFGLDIDVQNVGGERAYNVRLSLASEAFLPDGESGAVWRDGIRPGQERDFETRMRVAATATSGTYPIGVTVTWEDESGLQETLQTTIAVEVAGAVAIRPLIAVLDLRLPARVAPGAPFAVTFELQNTGGREARNVVVAPSAGPLALHGGGQAPPVSIGPGGVAAVMLRAVAADLADAGATAQTFEIRYDDENGVRYTDTRLVGISITSDDVYGPLPMIASYSAGEAVHPGEVFDLRLVVQNVGASAALRTFLALGGGTSPGATSGAGAAAGAGASLGVFAPLERSNRLFLDTLPAGESTELTQKMVVDGAAKPGVYVLDVTLSYEDADGQSHASAEVVTLLVSRRVDLEISPLEVITDTVVGQTVPFAVELVNAGTATVNVGQVKVVGGRYMDVAADPRFVGPLDASAADLVEARLTPRGAGEATVTVVVEYLDDFNQRLTFEEEFAFTVRAAETVRDGPEADEPPVASRPLFLRILRGLFGFGASDPARSAGGEGEGVDEGVDEGESQDMGDGAGDGQGGGPDEVREEGEGEGEREGDGEGTLGEPAMELEAEPEPDSESDG